MNTEGNGSLGVYALAEALGEAEMNDGLPLRPQAPAGGIFDRSLRLAGIPRQSLAISNVCRCRPPKNLLENMWYEVDAVNHCRQYMDIDVQKFAPKVMLAMGNIPLKYLTGYTGKKRTITNVRGFYLDGTRYQIPVVSTYHPSYISRDKPNLLGVFRLDILRAIALAKAGGRFIRPLKQYTIFPPLEIAQRFLADCRLNPDLPICYDIETAESITGTDEGELRATSTGGLIITKVNEDYQEVPEHLLPEDEWEKEQVEKEEVVSHTRITQIQFSLRPDGSAIVLPWEGDYIPVIRAILTTPNDKWMFNGRLFDNPILANHGALVKTTGRMVDFMDAFHFLQPDLPKGLQYVTSFYMPEAEPWKHTSASDPGEYGGDDVAYLRTYGGRLLADLRTRGLDKGFERHVIQLGVQLDRASNRGIPIDNDRRMELGVEMDIARAEVDAKLQIIYPDEIKLIEPKEGYKNDKLAEKRRIQVNEGLGDGEKWIRRVFQAPVEDRGDKQISIPTSVDMLRWCRLQPFLPNSSKQLLAYIKYKLAEEIKERTTRALRPQTLDVAERNAVYYIPKEFKTGKETTGKKDLERLGIKTGDKLFPMVIEHREYGKMKSTYVNGWAPGVDGCVHGRFTFGPATGQLSSKGPNTQNGIKHGRLASKFRAMIRAKPGYKLIEVDKTAFHALTLGFEARDPSYMRLARLDIHSFVAANILWLHHKQRFNELRLPPNPERWTDLPDAHLKSILSIIKKNEKILRDKKAKPCIAEGQLVLTDKGLIPIEKITLEHRVWDGLEWVQHGGIVFSGYKEVITYEGLTATPDHQVVTEAGTTCPLWRAASRLDRIECTGFGGQAIRTSQGDLLRATAYQRLRSYLLRMHDLWSEEMDLQGQPLEGSYPGMSVMQSEEISSSDSTRETVRCNKGPLRDSKLSRVQMVRSTGNQESVQIPRGVCLLGSKESSPQGLQGSDHRQDKQRWELRTGEPSIGHTTRTVIEQERQCVVDVSGETNSDSRIRQPLRLLLDPSPDRQGNDWGTDTRECGHSCSREGLQDVEDLKRMVQYARVYDIVNAGPRFCYTVSGKLVLNCILGIGFGLGAKKLYEMNRESFDGVAEAKKIQSIIKGLFPKVFKYQDATRELSYRQGFLKSLHGYQRWFFDVYHWDSKSGQLIPGKDSEAAIAFRPANNAFGMIKEEMLELAGLPDWNGVGRGYGVEDLMEKYGFINQIHDSLMFHCPAGLVEEALDNICRIMTSPSKVLVDPIVAPLGLSCGVEAMVGDDWSSMESVRIVVPS